MVTIKTRILNKPEFKFVPDVEYETISHETKKSGGLIPLGRLINKYEGEFDD
jgi:hypothetical protein